MTDVTNRLKETIPMGALPRSVDEAVNRLISELPLRYTAKIAKMNGRDLSALHATIGPHIREKYGLWTGNKSLMESCRMLSGQNEFHIDTASMMIIGAMWARLKRTHSLRAMK
jgi:Domain of unknown function (DUF6794)